MLQSMTGYGRGDASSKDVSVVVELRSVNNRFRDIQLRAPREYLALEPRINGVLKEPFTRGRIDAFVRRQVSGSSTSVVADTRLANEYASVINDLVEGMVGFMGREVPVTFILGQPGVLAMVEEEVDVTTDWDVVETALRAAVADLREMRIKEGKALYRDLLGYLAEVRTAVAEIEASSVGITERLHKRLEGRLRRLLTDRLDDGRVVQEAAVLADKADVAEEITRLRSHCAQFGEALDSGEPVGRRLDFLLQEMNREVNTIGSKAAEHPVSHKVVSLKSVLERMREQSANVE